MYCCNISPIFCCIFASTRSVTPLNNHANCGIIASSFSKAAHAVFANFACETVARIISDTATITTGLFTSLTASIPFYTLNRFPRAFESETLAAGVSLLTG